MRSTTNSITTSTLQAEIAKTWISGQGSCTLIIKQELAKQYGLDKPSHIIMEPKLDGILIKKLNLLQQKENQTHATE